MKEIILLEDMPEKLERVISDIKKEYQDKMTVKEVLYYNPQIEQGATEVQELSNKLGTYVKIVDLIKFESTLDELFRQEDTLFIFDTVLSLREIDVFSYRVNVSYAIRKREQGQGGRIWFYTVAGPDYKKLIDDEFGDYVFSAKMNGKELIIDLEGNKKFMEAIS